MINYNELSNEDLYEMCLSGEERAWQYVYNYILTICKYKKWDLEDPEELAQSAIVHLIDYAIDKIKEKHKFRTFIKTITINKINDYHRAKRSEISIDNVNQDEEGKMHIYEIPDQKSKSPLKEILSLEIFLIVNKAMAKLSELCQRVLKEYFKYKNGEYDSYDELSKVLNMPIPSISSKVSRCIEKLRSFEEIKALKA